MLHLTVLNFMFNIYNKSLQPCICNNFLAGIFFVKLLLYNRVQLMYKNVLFLKNEIPHLLIDPILFVAASSVPTTNSGHSGLRDQVRQEIALNVKIDIQVFHLNLKGHKTMTSTQNIYIYPPPAFVVFYY